MRACARACVHACIHWGGGTQYEQARGSNGVDWKEEVGCVCVHAVARAREIEKVDG